MGGMRTDEFAAMKDVEPRQALGKYTESFGLSLAITNVISALLVVAKENSEALMAWMNALTGHHWVTHGVLVLGLFLMLGLLLPRLPRGGWTRPGSDAIAIAIAVSVVASGLIIAGFFLSRL